MEALAALTHDPRPRVSVVVACEGYPERFVRGDPINIERACFDTDPDLHLFEGGVRVTPDGPETTGGRTYTVVAAGETLSEARERAYRGVEAIRFRGRHVRSDIGAEPP